MSATATTLRKALVVNSTATSFAAKVPTATKPSGTGIFDLLDYTSIGLHPNRQGMSKFLDIIPFGTAANNVTFDMQVWGWSVTNDATPLWIPQLLLVLNVVCGNITSTAMPTNTFMADTLTVAKGDANAPKISPATEYSASVLVHLRGCELIEFEFDADAGASASTDCNCYWRVLDQS